MEATENVQATDNGIENAETSEEVKVQKSDESLSENNKPDEAEKEQNEDKAELFRQAVLKSKRERAEGQNGYWALWHSFAERINATMTE